MDSWIAPLQCHLREEMLAREDRKIATAPVLLPPRPLVPISVLKSKIRAMEEDINAWKIEIFRLEAEDNERVADTTLREIIRFVSNTYQVSRKDIISSRRSRYIIIPRQIVMYLARTTTVLSLPQIGKQIGHRDHTTILHGANKIARLMREDKAFRARVEKLVAELTPEKTASGA